MRHWWIACAIVLLAAPAAATTRPCNVSGPRYHLATDATDWSLSIDSGQSCTGGVRFSDVIIESIKLTSSPQSGEVTLRGPSFTYTPKPDFHGQDSFAILVAGSTKKVHGTSTININVIVGGPVPTSSAEPALAQPLARKSPTSSGKSITAASCRALDVLAALTAVSFDGTTVHVPSGNCTWTSGITFALRYTTYVIGAGVNDTTIFNNNRSTPLFYLKIPYGKMFRLSSMAITPLPGATALPTPVILIGKCTSSGCPSVRVDNINFKASSYAWVIITDNLFGVIDHNFVTQVSGGNVSFINVNHSGYLGVGRYGDNSWTQPDSFGTNNALYVEDNIAAGGSGEASSVMTFTDCDHSDLYEHVGGCRMVVRYNALTNAFVGTHGTESTGRPRGARQVEVYDNTFTCTNTRTGCSAATGMRSGVILNYGNTYKTGPGSWFNNYVTLSAFRIGASLGGWGWCNGTGPWDKNDGIVYAHGTITGVSTVGGILTVTDSSQSWSAAQWIDHGAPYSIVDTSINGSPGYEIDGGSANSVSAGFYSQDYWNGPPVFNIGDRYEILRATVCIDQPSRNGSKLLAGDRPETGWVDETLAPSYEWNDTLTPGSALNHEPVGSQTARIIANRDYYYQEATFNGTSGVGSGPLSVRPASCTIGVAYWASDTSTLYRCSAVDTWTAYYTPYTYPHPLTSGTIGPAPQLAQ